MSFIAIKPGWTSLLSLIPILIYTSLYKNIIATHTTWELWLVFGALISSAMMYTWVVESGEEGKLLFFGFETGKKYLPGTYLLPNFFPFLREFGLNLGWHLATPERYSKTNRSDAENRIHIDDRWKRRDVYLQTDSFLKMNADRAADSLFSWLFTFKDQNGYFEYFRVGRMMFFFLIIIGLFGRVVAPKEPWLTTENVNNAVVGAVTSVTEPITEALGIQPSRRDGATLWVYLDKKQNEAKIWLPFPEDFRVGEGRTFYFNEIDGVRYLKYAKIHQSVPAVAPQQGDCYLLPRGQPIFFFPTTPPVHVSDVHPLVTYKIREDAVAWYYTPNKLLAKALLSREIYERKVLRKTASWENLYDNWGSVDRSQTIYAEGGRNEDIFEKTSPGGLICF
jgi:hypothetical protein